MRLVGGGAEAALAIGLIVLVVALEPHDLAVALEREQVRGDAVEEPSVVADHGDAAGEVDDGVFQRAARYESIRWSRSAMSNPARLSL